MNISASIGLVSGTRSNEFFLKLIPNYETQQADSSILFLPIKGFTPKSLVSKRESKETKCKQSAHKIRNCNTEMKWEL